MQSTSDGDGPNGQQLTTAEQTVLEVVYSAFFASGVWPVYQYVDKAIDELGIDLGTVLSRLPDDLVAVRGVGVVVPDPHDEVRLTVRGVARAGAQQDVELFLQALRVLTEKERAFKPAVASKAEELRVSSSELQEAMSVDGAPTAEAMARLRLLLQDAYLIYSGMTFHPETEVWDLVVSPRIRHYRGVGSLEDYLDRTRQLTGGGQSTAAIEPGGYLPEALKDPSSGWAARARAVLMNPWTITIASGIVVAIVVALLF